MGKPLLLVGRNDAITQVDLFIIDIDVIDIDVIDIDVIDIDVIDIDVPGVGVTKHQAICPWRVRCRGPTSEA